MMTVVSALAVLGLIPAFTVLYQPLLGESRRRSLRVTSLIALGCAAIWLGISTLLPGVSDSPLWLPTVAFAAVAGFLVSVPLRSRTSAARPVVAFCVAWTVLVFVPVVTATVFPTSVGLSAQGGALDLGGVLPVHAAAGAAALALLMVFRGRPLVTSAGAPTTGVVLAGGLLWCLWALALVSLELAFDTITPIILTNVVLAPVASILSWVLVERVRRHHNTVASAGAGLVCGLVAVSAGSGLLEPVWAILTGVIAGLVSASVVLRDPGSPRRALIGLHLLPAALGLVLLGLFTTGSGFIYTGQPTVAIGQIRVTGVVVLWSATVSAALCYLGPAVTRAVRSRRVTA
jgi:Amt family ammonium transporter